MSSRHRRLPARRGGAARRRVQPLGQSQPAVAGAFFDGGELTGDVLRAWSTTARTRGGQVEIGADKSTNSSRIDGARQPPEAQRSCCRLPVRAPGHHPVSKNNTGRHRTSNAERSPCALMAAFP